jgi:glycosyltransferase involved in cell wall biosynthesis
LKIFFFTRDTLSKKYGTSIHLADFLNELSRVHSIQVWEMHAGPSFKRKLLETCSCPPGLSISNFNDLCISQKFHLNLQKLRKRPVSIIPWSLSRIFKVNLDHINYLLSTDFSDEISKRSFDSLGQDFERALVVKLIGESKPLAVGTNYPWLSNLLNGLEVKTFSFIHDLRSRNVSELQKFNYIGDALRTIEDELFYSSENDFLITCNLQDTIAIKEVYKDLTVLNVSLSKDFSPKAKEDYYLQQSIQLVYVDAGGFGDHEIRKFLNNVWPKLIFRFPQISLRIVGGICNSMQDLANSENVVLEPWVEEIESVYLQCDLALILHFYRGGIKLKLFEALKNGVPVFASTAAIDGLPSDLVNSIEDVSFESLANIMEDIFSGKSELREYFERQKLAAHNFLELGYSAVLDHLV